VTAPIQSFVPARVVGDSIQAVSIRYNNAVYEMQQRGEDITVLSLGEAFFDIPLFPFSDLPLEKVYHYTHTRGIPELRTELATYFQGEYSVTLDPGTEILVTAGSKIGIYMALRALLEPGDEALVHEPAWVSYPEQIKLAYGVPVQVPYAASVYDFEKYVTGRTRTIILNNPNNPSGKIFSTEELTHVLALAQKHRLMVISDEAYSDFLPAGSHFTSMARLDPQKRHTIVVNSISKNFGISGWRLGYVISNRSVIDQVLKLNQHFVTCPASILQYYVAKHFKEIISITRPQIQRVVDARRKVVDFAQGIGLSALPGDATFYLFLSIAPSKLSSEDFATRLLQEHRVAVVPGSGYGKSCDAFVRASVGTEPLPRICAALERIKRLVDETS
jgi:aminotransferase